MIQSATQYPVRTLLDAQSNLTYVIPPYQREYSWQRGQWESLFQDLLEAEGQHFLGTIITLNNSTDTMNPRLELIDGQQRLTTLSILLAACYSVLVEHREELDFDQSFGVQSLDRQLVIAGTKAPRLVLQTQGENRKDYHWMLHEAGLPVDEVESPYCGLRRIVRCFNHFRGAILELAEEPGDPDAPAMTPPEAACRMMSAVNNAIIVKIEVSTASDAFTLFESLNNRGLPLSPVDLIKNQFLALSDARGEMDVQDAFTRWDGMLRNLGDSYNNHERFLRHYYNAFISELPPVANASVATKKNLIHIFETLFKSDLTGQINKLVQASALFGRIACTRKRPDPTRLDLAYQNLNRVQAAPSYVLLLWLEAHAEDKNLTERDLTIVTDMLVSFFARRNVTGYPATYVLPRMFMGIIKDSLDKEGAEVLRVIAHALRRNSSDDETFRSRLEQDLYTENVDAARFVLTSLSEQGMTDENRKDLWERQSGKYVWTIEHILPQGEHLPAAWIEMLGGEEAAAQAQADYAHKLGNLTFSVYNSNLGNRGFLDKRDHRDTNGNFIGYRNGIPLNADLATKESWGPAEIQERTEHLVDRALARFPLPHE
ncbi:DUF262 domain-containing protein [Kocuria sp.]|uniref:DUF262 domain-containing protein n=1 Tax=Kocuria sp. TaxID=1871328 RepID=UPI0025C26A71|nr:DUF262 domain-containing HNH endonuclease family protein [Kocuria sp.]